ncbi:hypothetical protein LUW74_37485 [Actinomadura madurae]|uniref:TetR family transcriptional regulator C-terminal domain-containing protein n=1 Tax=Actinomadura madurae TaxID=1993 RepID=UPI0020274072|nr:TetR family transcriptional regulator C-terminal domain-containing protein [Actinomadura madurae]URN10784.1 hypothetical protein LUW74_37485 [Actinomadura madurae]
MPGRPGRRDRVRAPAARRAEGAGRHDGAVPRVRREVLQVRRRADQPAQPVQRRVRPGRDSAVAIYREVVEGSDLKIDKEFRAELPELLWIYSMGIVLYWVHDSSPGCRKTYLLVERTVPLVNRMVSMSRLPGFKSVTRELVGIIREVRA